MFTKPLLQSETVFLNFRFFIQFLTVHQFEFYYSRKLLEIVKFLSPKLSKATGVFSQKATLISVMLQLIVHFIYKTKQFAHKSKTSFVRLIKKGAISIANKGNIT